MVRLGHVMVGVSNIQRSLAFYRDVMDLDVTLEQPGFAFLNAGGGVDLVLSEAHGALYPLVGSMELSFSVSDIMVAFTELRKRGVNFMTEPRLVTATQWAANFTDPDGHLLSVVGPKL